jgi:hypothetical protein
MQPNDVRQLLTSMPFRPFRFKLTDGTSYDVRHPELVMVGRSTIFLGMPANGDEDPLYEDFRLIDLLHIMQAEPLDTAHR